MPSKPMLTSPLHNHPWTRVSWISGSDIDDDLDEEEVQEVESITLGRAFSNSTTNDAPSAVVSPGSTNDAGNTKSPSVTLKPFSFETAGEKDSENSSVLAPFVVEPNLQTPKVNTNNNDNNSNGSVSSSTESSDGDVLVSQKGHLITPAAKDTVTEEDTTIVQKHSVFDNWPMWVPRRNNKEEQQEEIPLEDVKTSEVKEEIKSLWNEEPNVVVEQEDPEVRIFALQKERLGRCWEATKRSTVNFFHWIVDALSFLWIKLVFLCIQLKTKILNGLTLTKEFTKESSSKAMTFLETKVASSEITPSGRTVACGLMLGLAAVIFMIPTKRTPSPTSDLREFVRFEKAHNVVDFKVIDELNTEAFRTYARSTCVEAPTFEQARNALDVGLFGVPDGVRSIIVQMAVLEGVTQKNSVQDSNSDFVNSGKADAFMAFWSTVYDPSDEEETYKSCVMVTGVALTVAETVAEWTTKREKYQVGTEPCQCGYMYCEECPVFDVREVKWPIFERRSLSLKKQEELRHWMVDQAIKSAEHLVLDGSDTLSLGSGSSLVRSPSFSWTGQTSSAFFGEESHRDRLFHSSSSVNDQEL